MSIWRRKRSKEASAIQSISAVSESLSQDQSGRARRYFISMMIRTACFILTVVLPSPYRWVALFGAVILPYVAVVIANAGRETVKNPSTQFNARELH